MIVPVGIALGSNLGDRSAELDGAVSFLRTLSEADRVRESPPFLNSVAEIEIDTVILPPLLLLACLQEFEVERGRSPLRDANAARPLDLDIIYYGVEQISQLGLVIPHPRAAGRRFVLEPLSRLRPDLILPGQTKTVRELLAGLS